MAELLARRLIQAVAVLLGVAIITFLLLVFISPPIRRPWTRAAALTRK